MTTRVQLIADLIVKVTDKIKQVDPGYRFGPEDTIEYANNVKGQKAGVCIPAIYSVAFNPHIPDSYIEQTVAHEVCHIWAYAKGEKGHGPTWKKIMTKIGYAPNRCHSLDLPSARNEKRFVYTCSCKEHLVTTRVHNRIRKNQMIYKCCQCGTQLKEKKNV